ncbi:MAG: DNA polymerase I [Bacteroidales bacterium]|nr:DNA polymerase I [Bacteroidales bacterium]
MKKLMLLDGMAMTYRAYYALNHNPRMNSRGMNTSAVLGFTTTLYDLLRQQHPTHCAVAFDVSAPTFRHERFEEYKANREAMPEAIQQALPYIHRVINGFSIPVVTAEGYEADDVIGTLAHQAEQAGFDEVLMITPDKDFAQLVTDNIHLYRFGRMGKPDMIYGPAEVCEKFGVVRPDQVADLLGLWGDAIDNIPGIPGVGEKKAKQLIEQFDTVENLVQHSDEIRNEKLRILVKEYADQALLSKELATITVDAPVTFDEPAFVLGTPDYEGLSALFTELEFRNFAKKLYTDLSVSDPDLAMKLNLRHKVKPGVTEEPAESKRTAQRKTAKPADPQQFSLFDMPAQQEAEKPQTETTETKHAHYQEATMESIAELQDRDFALYLHTDPKTSNVLGIAFATDETHVSYLPFAGNDYYSFLQSALENESTRKVCYNLKQLKHIFLDHGVQIRGEVFDVQLAHYLMDPEARHLIDFIVSNVLGETLDEQSEEYPYRVAEALLRLYEPMRKQLIENDMLALYNEVEIPLVDVLVDMENVGVRIDVDAIRQYSTDLSQQRDEIENNIYELAGKPFNISSPRQLGEVLYEQLKVTDKPPLTATKQYSTAEDVLQKLRERHPIIPMILEYRSLNKLISTYLDTFPKLINPQTGRLHTIYNQTVTATGRLSSSNPNLQNIPIRTERGREIRKAFVPADENHSILAADYSQIELRIIASLANDEHMIDAFAHHYDIHAATAAKIYHLDIADVTKEQRRNAKSVNFGIVYGISAFGLSEQLQIPRKEAAALIEEYFQQYPAIKRYIDENVAFAHEHGYACTLLGRRRYLYDINSRNASLRSFAERNAVNMPIQGTSADMIKIAMIRIWKRFQQLGLQSKMTLQVHDELVFDVLNSELETVADIVRTEMLTALPLSIPIEVSVDVGKNWLEAH